MKKHHKILIICSVILCFLASFLYYLDDTWVWDNGLRYLRSNTGTKYDYSHQIDSNAYTIELDLNHLDSNIDKEIYKNGRCSIDIEKLEWNESGGYLIQFYSHGTYSPFGGKLVDGMSHSKINNQYCGTFTASLTATYNGIQYESPFANSSGLLRNDGSIFSFYLFPESAYTDGSIPVKHTGTVTITLSNLTKSTWSRL